MRGGLDCCPTRLHERGPASSSRWRAASQRRRAERAQEALRQARAQARAASRTGQVEARRRGRIVAALDEKTAEAQAVLTLGAEGPRSFALLPAEAARRAIVSLRGAIAAYDADTFAVADFAFALVLTSASRSAAAPSHR